MQTNWRLLGFVAIIAFIAGMLLASQFQCNAKPAVTVPPPLPAIEHDTLKTGQTFFDTVTKLNRRIDTLILHDTVVITDTIEESVTGANTLVSLPKKPDIYSIAPSPATLMGVFVPPAPRQLFEVWGGINYNLLTSKDGAAIEGDLNLDRLGLFNATLFGEIRLPIEVNLGIKGKLWGGNL